MKIKLPKWAWITLGVVVLLLILVGCGSGGPHGTVTEKEYKAGHYECVTKTAKPKSGKPGSKSGGSKGSKPKSGSGPKVRTGRGRAATVPHLLCTGGKTKRWVKPCYQIELDDDEHELCVNDEKKWDAVKVGDKW